MRNLKVFIAYNGAAYHGFQRQDNALTVQEAVENSIGKLLKIPAPVIYGCSRTDTGVHARQFCFNVHVDSRIPCEGFVKGMNTLLPPDIAVLSCEDAPEDFHARYCTKSKEYVYLIANTVQRDVFLQNLAYHYPYPLDLDKMNEAERLLVGDDVCELRISGSGFLYNMVRICAGTLIYINEGKLTTDDIRRALQTGDRSLAGKTLPPEGLYLNRVIY